ncbi:cob(I)yrinic acid a,c-diamide adenosyltransferase [Hymenobacter busanensis]|uniref:Corrinoid adenosyltransferase n=1 Tax=Hymenobacter busanensis TaxID=2607656 RepID=A0A7L5A1B8_9BACT|nr:cob(I)yrinic acid a,c-diamide adenosyltransferase [Hymenobacter busanensis]KAA9338305.1 cob(I)yrinic acid a,c-diamide adenosyltransferase [Hymenobacter busanensis]QHJ09271.1 cob(I)yrinic acid a,c-diamide adenosyltransferase [Hymenobacter busanensis]
MKIYTRTGDKGLTSLIGGTRVPKSSLRIEAYGTVDELNSWIGLVRDQDVCALYRPLLKQIQDRLFTIGATLASDPERARMALPDLHDADVLVLEQEMDRMNDILPELRHFILPGGHPSVSYAHVARCVCRRAERLAISLREESFVPDLVVMYLNRLSDYLFVLARLMCHDLGSEEITWQPRG